MPTSRRFRIKHRSAIAEINVVPYIDVMLVLLVIFMVTAPLISPTIIDIPSTGNANRLPDQILNIEINKDNTLRLRLQNSSSTQIFDPILTSKQKLVADIKALHLPTQTPIVIAADKNIIYDEVIQTMEILRSEGIEKIGLLTKAK